VKDLFDIAALECSYPSNNLPVLFIERLTIPKGKMTVVLGRSGSGKSTLVEALGLMNNTISNGSACYFSPSGDEDLAAAWRRQKRAAAIRRDYFSFIFQDDYLMPYYSCQENMLITGLIQRKIPSDVAVRLLKKPLESLNLSGNGLLHQQPSLLAGGQKQRLSFIRAIVKDFDVLFGDEPTGNLDNTNSAVLFDFIRLVIAGGSRSAVIVSHNVELSVEKADRIIVLTPANDHSSAPYHLDPAHVFNRTGNGLWDNFPETRELISHIKSIL